MMEPKQEIETIIQRYNQEEKEQGQRLGRLFYLLKRRKGYRKVLFNNGAMWSSCWGQDDRTDHDLHVRRLDRSIKQIEMGDE